MEARTSLASVSPTPRPDRTRRPPARRGWLLGTLATVAALAGMSLHNLVTVLRLRRAAGVDPGEHDPEAHVGEGTGTPLRLVVLGDSAARGYGLTDGRQAYPFQVAAQLASAAGRRVHVTSLATDGARTADLVATQVPTMRRLHPDVVVCSVGVNDALNRTPRRQLRDDTEALLTAVVAAAPGAPVAFAGTPDLSTAPGFPWPLKGLVGVACRRAHRVQRAVAATVPEVSFVAFPTPTPDMYGADGFHPGPRGQAAAAQRTVAALVDAGRG